MTTKNFVLLNGEKNTKKKIIPADEKKIPPDEKKKCVCLRSEKTEQKIETTATVSANDPFSLSGRIYKPVI
jgi:hypothetical protein